MFLCLGHLFRLLDDNHTKSTISFRALMTTYHRNSKVNLFLILVLYCINSKLKYKLQFASWRLMFTQLLMTFENFESYLTACLPVGTDKNRIITPDSIVKIIFNAKSCQIWNQMEKIFVFM